jgi:hypothetical protein
MQKKFLCFLLVCSAFITTNVMAATYILINRLPTALALNMEACVPESRGWKCTSSSETIQPGQTVYRTLSPAPQWMVRAVQGSSSNRRAVFGVVCTSIVNEEFRGVLLFQPFDNDGIMCIPAAK